jgi:hypothetical protein
MGVEDLEDFDLEVPEVVLQELEASLVEEVVGQEPSYQLVEQPCQTFADLVAAVVVVGIPQLYLYLARKQ